MSRLPSSARRDPRAAGAGRARRLEIDEVILGQAYPSGEDPAIGRVAALDAGLPIEVPGMQLDRRCGSGLQAVMDAAMRVQTGVADAVIAGGAESMSRVEHYALGLRWGVKAPEVALMDRLARGRVTAGGRNHVVEGGMLETAENLRREMDIPREEQDELALRSHQRAVAAQQEGRFDDELVPVTVATRKGEVVVDTDEHPRADTDLASLAKLRPVRGRIDDEATVTAGNASGQNDGAAVCLVTTPERAEDLGLRPLARLVSWGLAGVGPARMGIGPVPATERALARAGLTLADMDLIELNEAFAAQVLAVTKTWGFGAADHDRTNVNGSGISLGHPVGATGRGSWPPSCGRWTVARPATGSRRCASAVAKASPRSSSASPPEPPGNGRPASTHIDAQYPVSTERDVPTTSG
jgi:acetyl-CoA C-acetyltransferase